MHNLFSPHPMQPSQSRVRWSVQGTRKPETTMACGRNSLEIKRLPGADSRRLAARFAGACQPTGEQICSRDLGRNQVGKRSAWGASPSRDADQVL
ncbi:hypothetical protein B0T16DRAFT_408876 [Cercophora newfieldiana]|uniref:Uncharacterized protein n=1 Tax=Cercophora newfieldiana TaxID=92897 RepID=A0AA39YA17_9PEZI|nr:hypothetical protein B0T16DRAFT_408876 [Cercophora newfieldiana]